MTWNHKLRWKTSFITTFSLLIVACCATVPRLCAGQTYDDTALYIDDPTVSTFNDSVSATYVDQEPSPDTAYRQLVAGNARYLKEDLPAAQAVPRIAAGTNQYPIATIVYSPDMPVQPTTLTQTNTRNVYLTPIDFEAFKESGGIEYTADVVLGLQVSAIHDPIFDKEGKIKEKREKIAQAKDADPREIELVCLKNRYGRRYTAQFTYYPQYDCYFEGVHEYKASDFYTGDVKRI